MRLAGSPWGERPVRSAYQYAQMETKLTVEMSRCAALLIGYAERPASQRRLRALVMVFGPRRLPGWPGICGLVVWLAARFGAGR